MKILNESHNQNGDLHSNSESLGEKNQAPSSVATKDIEATNGTHSSELQDPLSPIDAIPFGVEGIQTVIKNNQEKQTKKSLESKFSNEQLMRLELQKYKEEIVQLRSALKEASRVNQQWRNYHDQRQEYVQKLLASLHELQQVTTSTQVEDKTNAELQRLRDTLSRQQKEHREHIQLLQLQVRAHRDDWEAERSEKKAAETGRLQAETKVAILQEQLEHVKNKFSDLEAHFKLCKCFSVTNGECSRNANCFTNSDKNLNDNSINSERMKSTSPNRSSSISNLSDQSRSRSISMDLSKSSSPTPLRNVSASSSPSFGLSLEQDPPSDYEKSLQTRINESEVMEHLSSAPCSSNKENQPNSWNPSSSLSLTAIADKMHNGESHSSSLFLTSATNRKTFNGGSELESSSKPRSKGNGRCGENVFTENNLDYYESKGARPKALGGKFVDEDERQAKHRARSILASALPLSPSSSKPSSPLTVSLSKSSNIPKGYLPITSTVLTSVTYRPPFPSNKRFDHTHNHPNDTHQSIMNSRSATDFLYMTHKKINKLKTNLRKSNSEVEVSLSTTNDKHSEKVYEDENYALSKNNQLNHKKKSPTVNSSELLINGIDNDETEYKNYSPLQINGSGAHNNHDHNGLISKTSNKEELMKSAKSNETDNEQNITINPASTTAIISHDIKTASKMKQNQKSLTVTNSQQDITNTNYAAITIMPGPSSALYSHSQTTSTTSSRSSSPGFSLTTFALNANGQGVPGAIFFAIGSENKPMKSSHQSCVSVLTPSSNEVEEKNKTIPNISEPSSAIKNVPVIADEDLNDNVSSGKLINSTWVRLMDKENNSTRSGSGIPWRTARAVPSHQLNSVRKTSQEENSTNGIVSSSCSITKSNCSSVIYSQASSCHYRVSHSNSQNGMPTQSHPCKARCQTNFSPTPNFISYSHATNDSIIVPTNEEASQISAYPQSAAKGSQSPSICVISHSSMTSLGTHTDSHLKSMASRNISSAILSYECGNRTCVIPQGDESIVEFKNQQFICNRDQNYSYCKENSVLGESSIQYLICPSCQKLFSNEHGHEYERHLELCGGPKFVDM